MQRIDINSDVGEGMGNDEILMQYISSANIACGVHAGSPEIMKRTVEWAIEYGVAIGAHFSYPDREQFGRVDMFDQMDPGVLMEIIIRQIRNLKSTCMNLGVQLDHVKPHGALYNRAARDPKLSQLICEAIKNVDPGLPFFCASKSLAGEIAKANRIPFVHEVFADRGYESDGSLTPRSHKEAVIRDTDQSIAQVLQMIRSGTVRTRQNTSLPIIAESVCIHGDEKGAVRLAKMLADALKREGIAIKSPNK